MPVLIADTACVDPTVELGDGVEIGPYCVIGPGVRIGRGTRLVAHVCVFGPTTLGSSNLIAPFVTIGRELGPFGTDQPGRVEIGDGNRIGSCVVIDAPSEPPALTRIGSNVLIGPGVHVGGSADLGALCRLDSAAVLGELVSIGQGSVVSAGVTIHPRVTIGAHSFIGGPTRVFHDVPPYLLADGHPAKIRALHIVGLKRLGIGAANVRALHEAHRLLFRGRVEPGAALETLRSRDQATPEVEHLVAFLGDQARGAHGRARDRRPDPLADELAA